MTFDPTKWVCALHSGNGPPACAAEGGISDEKLIIKFKATTRTGRVAFELKVPYELPAKYQHSLRKARGIVGHSCINPCGWKPTARCGTEHNESIDSHYAVGVV
jgi:hypothetical protein